MNPRALRSIRIALEALVVEMDNLSDIFFKERPFLEDHEAPRVVYSFFSERKESEQKVERMKENVRKMISAYMGNPVEEEKELNPLNPSFLAQTEIFDQVQPL